MTLRLQAQVSTAVSNLDLDSADNAQVSSGEWAAQAFTTGNETSLLDSILLPLFGFNWESTPYVANLYTSGNANLPGLAVGSLTAVEPEGGGTPAAYSFVANDNIRLGSNQQYWVVLGTTAAPFSWSWTESIAQVGRDGWSVSDRYAVSSNQGTSWSYGAELNSPYQLEVLAEAYAGTTATDQTVISNTAQTTSDYEEITAVEHAAAMFTTGSEGFSLGTIGLPLLVGTASSELRLQLLADNGSGEPGDLVGTLTPDEGETGLFLFSPEEAIFLSATTEYWIALGLESGAGNYFWAYTESSFADSGSQTGSSIGYIYASGDGTTWTVSSGTPYQFEITSLSAVPEPATLAMMAALIALARAGGRRRRSGARRVGRS